MDPAVTALVGAAVGIAGTGALQQVRFRREDKEGRIARLGICRALRAELGESAFVFAMAEKRGKVITSVMRFPTEVWRQQGHHLGGVLAPEEFDALFEAYGRLGRANDAFIGAGKPGHSITIGEVVAEGSSETFDLDKLQIDIGAALVVLESVERRLSS